MQPLLSMTGKRFWKTLSHFKLLLVISVQFNWGNNLCGGPGWLNAYTSYKPITNTAWVRARLCKLQKGCTRLAAASDKVYQLIAHGWWFSPGPPAFSTTKTIRHDIAEILLKVALNTKNKIKFNLCVNKCVFILQ
jgi:hypothetical protein